MVLISFFGLRTAVAVDAHRVHVAWWDLCGIIPIDRDDRESTLGYVQPQYD